MINNSTWYDNYGNQVDEGSPLAVYDGSAYDRTSGMRTNNPQRGGGNSYDPAVANANNGLTTPSYATTPTNQSFTDPNRPMYDPSVNTGGTPPPPPGNTITPPPGGGGNPNQPSSPFANPFLPNPTVAQPDGTNQKQNPIWWATQDTADQVAKLLGGTVSAQNPFAGNFSANQPQYMVKLPDGRMINPGTDVADLYNHGYSQSYIEEALQRLISNDYSPAGPNNRQPMQLDPSVAPFYNRSPNGTVTLNNTGKTADLSGGATNNTNDFLTQLQKLLTPDVQKLYGSNPLLAALGLQTPKEPTPSTNFDFASLLQSLTGGGVGGQNMQSIAQLLNAMYSMRQQPSSGILSPLFWGQQQQGQGGNGFGTNALQNYFPIFP